jgi:hypothetical protein
MKGGLMNELTPEAAREAGLGLWDASRRFTKTLIGGEAGLASAVLVGAVVRCRRLLRAAYAAADAGYKLEAMALVRSMNEWAITTRLHRAFALRALRVARRDRAVMQPAIARFGGMRLDWHGGETRKLAALAAPT